MKNPGKSGQAPDVGDPADAGSTSQGTSCFAFLPFVLVTNLYRASCFGESQISSTLYNTLMPLVKDQVRAQIKVADFSRLSVAVAPADYSSWNEVSDTLTREAVAPIKAEHKRSLSRVAGNPEKEAEINAYYQEQIEDTMTRVANDPREISLELGVEYNFLRGEEDSEMP